MKSQNLKNKIFITAAAEELLNAGISAPLAAAEEVSCYGINARKGAEACAALKGSLILS